MTVTYFKKNGICYSYDTSGSTSVPPPGAIIINSAEDTYENCDDCCRAPRACPYGDTDEGNDELVLAFEMIETLCENSTVLSFSGPITITRTPTTGYVVANCTWTGTVTEKYGSTKAAVSLILVDNGSDGEWTITVTIPSSVPRTYSTVKINDIDPLGSYPSVEETCSTSDTASGSNIYKISFTGIAVSVPED